MAEQNELSDDAIRTAAVEIARKKRMTIALDDGCKVWKNPARSGAFVTVQMYVEFDSIS
jgi:hypothetical protein